VPSNRMSRLESSPSMQVARLMDGYLITQLLYVAVKLGVADALAAGPLPTDALAAAVDAEPDILRRVLRGLASEDILEELPEDHFGLTELGTCLRVGVRGSLRGAITVRGDLYFVAAAGLLDAVRTGDVAFERAHGRDLFSHLSRHPDLSAVFQASMTDRSAQEATDVVAAYEFGRFDRLVDVGGGTGILLERILAANPHLDGVLFDRPDVVGLARDRIATTAVSERCTFASGDFFAGVPTGGDAYLLSRVIHDWDDAAALQILGTCHRAMNSMGTLVLVEAILPALAEDSPAAIRMDLHMLLLLGGRERTEVEFTRLLATAGFSVIRIVPTTSPVGLAVIEAVSGAVDRG
jgi:hypothetical protein